MENAEPLRLGLILALLSAGGAVGGFLELIRNLKFQDSGFSLDGQKLSWLQFFGLFLIEGILGIGGALAVTLVMLLARQFPTQASTQPELVLLTLYVVAGFAGRRILPIVSRGLEQKLEEATRVANEAKKKAQDATKLASATEPLTAALALLREPKSAAEERMESMRELELVFDADRNNRKVAIILGRLHEESPQLEEDGTKRLTAAINVLSKFLDAKKAAAAEDIDYAAGLYNRACYRMRLYEMSGNLADRESGYRDLERSVEIDPANKDEAKVDAYFPSVRNDERFKKITA